MKPRNCYDRIDVRTPVGELVDEKTGEITPPRSRAKQGFRDDCDVNLIVKRHAQTGQLTHVNTRQPTYGDFTAETDLRSAIELVSQAEREFMALPASVRALCDNDPATFLHAMASEEGVHALAAAGLPMGAGYKPPAPPGAAAGAPAPALGGSEGGGGAAPAAQVTPGGNPAPTA